MVEQFFSRNLKEIFLGFMVGLHPNSGKNSSWISIRQNFARIPEEKLRQKLHSYSDGSVVLISEKFIQFHE